MSYNLHFWNQSPCCTLEPSKVLEQLTDCNIPSGVESLPSDKIRGRILEEFPSIEDLGSPSLTWESGDECFLVSIGENCIDVESHGATAETLNQLIELAIEFDCHLYDPQTGVRYVG